MVIRKELLQDGLWLFLIPELAHIHLAIQRAAGCP